MSQLTYPEAVVVGALQGLAELFPVSSLGHSVLLPALVGGQWGRDLNVSTPESPYLAFIVGLHVATAAALLAFYWRDWLLIIRGFGTSVARRRVTEPYERLAWLIILATIPVGVSGLLLEHTFRTTLGRPVPAAAFLLANGVVLAVGERLSRRPVPIAVGARSGLAPEAAPEAARGAGPAVGEAGDLRLAGLSYRRGTLIGTAQVLALLPGISRSGVKLAGSLTSFVSAYLAIRFLTRYFRSGTLRPFAWYCIVAGAASLLWLLR